jgi:deoxycytidine triphosphate deaminase
VAEISAGQLKVLERLIGDEELRISFFEDPDAAIAKAGIDLSGEELAALKKIDQAVIDGLLANVGERLSKTGAGAIFSPTEATSAVLGALSETFIIT